MPVQVHGTTTEVTCTIPVRSMTTECHGTRANPGPHNIQCAPTPDGAHARLPRSPDSFTDSLTPQGRGADADAGAPRAPPRELASLSNLVVLMASLVVAAAAVMSASAASPIANVTEIADGVLMPAVSMGHSDSSSATSQRVAALWLSLGGRGLDTANSCKSRHFSRRSLHAVAIKHA